MAVNLVFTGFKSRNRSRKGKKKREKKKRKKSCARKINWSKRLILLQTLTPVHAHRHKKRPFYRNTAFLCLGIRHASTALFCQEPLCCLRYFFFFFFSFSDTPDIESKQRAAAILQATPSLRSISNMGTGVCSCVRVCVCVFSCLSEAQFKV